MLILKASTQETFTLVFETAGTDQSAACLVLILKFLTERLMIMDGPLGMMLTSRTGLKNQGAGIKLWGSTKWCKSKGNGLLWGLRNQNCTEGK